MTRSLWAVTAAAVLAVGLAACGGSSNDGGGSSTKPTTCTPPATATVKFSADVYPILTANCGTCHGDAGTLPKFGSATVATSYAAVQPEVTTSNPAQSPLIVKGTGGNSHGGGVRLSATEATTIQKWIEECAQNN